MTQWRKWLWLLVGAVALGEIALYIGWHGASWLFPAQLALIWLMLAGMVLWLDKHTPARKRRQVRLMLWPALVLQGLSVLWPAAAFFFGGGAAGWLIAASLIVRKQQRVEYQRAIRALRAGDYEQAIALMSRLIQAEPDAAEHYNFRATIHRMRGHPQPAVADYQRAIELEPESPSAFVGLAETYLQMQRYEDAARHAERARELSPRDWSTYFLLGQTAHRQGDWAGAVQALERAQQLRISQPTSRLLAHLWLALDTFRLGQEGVATQHLAALRKEEAGIRLWERIFAAEQGSALRGMLGNDVQLARKFLAAGDPLAELRRSARQSPKS